MKEKVKEISSVWEADVSRIFRAWVKEVKGGDGLSEGKELKRGEGELVMKEIFHLEVNERLFFFGSGRASDEGVRWRVDDLRGLVR